MPSSEPRYPPHYRLNIPFVHRPKHPSFANGHRTTSINISFRGVFLLTSHRVSVKLRIRVVFADAKTITGALPTETVHRVGSHTSD
jgi:hypothetical protein